MGSLVFYLVGMWIGSAYGPGALPRQLAAATAIGHLPLQFAGELERDVAVSLHYSRALSMATYLPAVAGRRERLDLYAPFYVRGLDLRPVVDMPLDVCEYYFHALLEAYLRRQLGTPGSALGGEIRRRAAATMSDVPPERRVEAYVDALASFGSHLLAVANEMERKEEQRRDRGGLCPLLGRDLPLMRLWERMFASGGYPGAYTAADGSVRFSRAVLTAADKELLLESVLRTPWRGSPQRDLGPRYCRE